MRPMYLLTLICTKGHSLGNMVINAGKIVDCGAFE